MENVKEYFMDTDCYPTYRDADWDLADEYRKLNIDKKIVTEWTNEYYEKKLQALKRKRKKILLFVIFYIILKKN